MKPPLHWRKLGGVYPTPPAIVDAMLGMTLAQLLQAKTPEQLQQDPIRILEPACGDGIFLVQAYRSLLNWHRTWYVTHDTDYDRREQAEDGTWHLTVAECQRLFLDSIYGVDIDPGAIATTRQALWQVIQREIQTAPSSQPSLVESWDCSPLAAPLHRQIKLGNTILGSDFTPQKTENGGQKAEDRNGGRKILCTPHPALLTPHPTPHPQPPTPYPLPSTLHTPPPTSSPFHWQAEFPEVAQAGGFDLVIGNPPYVDSEHMQAHQPDLRAYCNQHYQTASGNWDLFCVFIERTIALCKPGGLTSLIVPNKLLSARYAAATRQVLTSQCHLLALRDYSQVPVFPVAVYPIVYVAQRSPTPTTPPPICYEQIQRASDGSLICASQQDLDPASLTNAQQPWAIAVHVQPATMLHRLQTAFPTLADMAEVSGAATVAEAYQLQPHIQNAPESDLSASTDQLPLDRLPMVNSGTIDRYHHHWGHKPMRYLGTSYLRPVIAPTDLPPRRQQQATQPKLILAGLSQVLECVIDPHGTVLAGKSTVIVRSSLNLFYLLALLNSQLLSHYYQQVFSGDCLQGGYLRIGLAQVRSLPIVPYDSSSLLQTQIITHAQRLWELWQLPEKVPATATTHRQVEKLDRHIDRLVNQLYDRGC